MFYTAPMEELAKKACIPCRGDVPPLTGDALGRLADELGHGWKVVGEHHLEKTFHFDDFASALAFVNRVGGLAEEVGHHPDLHLAWGKVSVEIWTHVIDGLTETDFVFAAKTEALAS